MADSPDNPIACPSCGHTLDVRYCTYCGEERLDPHKLTVWYFLTHSLVPEFLNFDGKTWRTLRFLLFRPGFLAVEYAAGRRRPYIAPFRVFLVAFVIYVLSAQGLGFSLNIGDLRLSLAPTPMPLDRSLGGTLDQIDRFGIIEGMLTEKIGPLRTVTEENGRSFNSSLNSVSTGLSVTTVLLLGIVLRVCFYRRRPLLAEHVVFSLHYFSFVLLSSMLSVVAIKSRVLSFEVLIPLLILVSLWQFSYLLIAVKRFYLPERRKFLTSTIAAGVAVLVYLLNSLFITALQLLAGIFAVVNL